MLKTNYPEFSTYEKSFQADDALMVDFFSYAEKEGVKKDEKGYAASEKLIKSQLKVSHVSESVSLPFQSFNFNVDPLCFSIAYAVVEVIQ